MYRHTKLVFQKLFWRLLLPVTLILALAGCVSAHGYKSVTLSTETEQKAIWVLGIQYGEHYLPGGGMGGAVGENTGRGRASIGVSELKIPESVTYRWYDNIVHYSKYKDMLIHEYTVQIPKELPKLRPDQNLLLLFLIKMDNTVTVEVRPR